MFQPQAILQVVKPLIVLAHIFLLLRLYRSKLHLIYRYFTAYILFELVRTIGMGMLNSSTNLYAQIYFATEPVTWFFYIVVILEIFGVVLKRHQGIATLGRRALFGALGLATLIAASTLLLNLQHPSPQYRILDDFLVLERLIMISLLLFVVLFLAFFSYFPLKLPRNAAIHAMIFGIYFTVKAVAFLSLNLFGMTLRPQMNLFHLTVHLLCLLAWARMLTAAGEAQAARPAVTHSKYDEARLLAQLEAINATLLGSTKK